MLIWASTVTSCFLIFAFAILAYVPVVITRFSVGIKICAITSGIKKYKSTINKKKKNMIK